MKNRIAVMASIVTAMLIVSMDTTILNTTMPTVAGELGGFELYAWTFASYMIFSTVLSPIAGRLSDLFGRKKVFAAGIILFMFGSVLCGSAQSMLQLVIFRAIQGFGAGVMLPFPAIIAGDLFKIEQRGKIQALFSAMWALSAIIAPLLGAFFVEFATWRWIFYVNIPVCLASLLLLIPYKEVYEPKPAKIDYLGAFFFAAGAGLLLLLTVVDQYHLLYAILGITLLIVFYLYERKHTSPIVPLNLLADRSIAWMIANSFLAYTALIGASSYLPLYLQERGYSIFISGVALIGMSLGWTVSSVPAGKWILKYGYRKLMIIGNVMLVLTAVWFLYFGTHPKFLPISIGAVFIGITYGLLTTVTTIGAQQLVGPLQKGISTSMQTFSRNIGTAVGVTIMGAFMTNALNLVNGFKWMYIFAFIVSLFAFLSALFIREKQPREQA